MTKIDQDNRDGNGGGALKSVEDVFERWLLTHDQKALRAVLSAVAAHYAGGEGVWLFIIDSPGSGKTEVIRSLGGLSDVYPLSDLTPQTFASGLIVRGAGKDPSLLLRLPAEPIVTLKDFTTVLSMHHDSRQQILAQLRELADGYYRKEFGNGKTVSWQGRMCFIAGVTPALDNHWAVNQTLGERFIQVRPQAPAPTEVAQRSMANVGQLAEMRRELQAVVTEFFTDLECPPIATVELETSITLRLAALATLVVRARSAVFRDGYRGEISYIPVPEGPARLSGQLATLARGRAIIENRREVSETDFEEVVAVGFDCIPPPRRLVLEELIRADGELTTAAVATETGYPSVSARRILEDLVAIGLARRRKVKGGDLWRLSAEAILWHKQIRFTMPFSEKSGGEGIEGKDIKTYPSPEFSEKVNTIPDENSAVLDPELHRCWDCDAEVPCGRDDADGPHTCHRCILVFVEGGSLR